MSNAIAIISCVIACLTFIAAGFGATWRVSAVFSRFDEKLVSVVRTLTRIDTENAKQGTDIQYLFEKLGYSRGREDSRMAVGGHSQ